MLRKSTLLAVAASAALGLSMIASTAASAHGGHGGGGMRSGGGMHFARVGGGHRIGHPGGRWHHRYVHWHRPIWYARPVGYSYGVATTTPGPCTCLSKEYTPEGAVLFKDRCTNETAMNPPAQPDPQQTGAAETQQQFAQQYVQPTPANAKVPPQPAK